MGLKQKLQESITLKNLLSWVGVAVGVTVMSLGFVLFTNPYKIIPGGVYGLGRVLHHLIPSIQTGTFGFMLDVPLMILNIIIFGASMGSKTIFAAVISPFIMNGLTSFFGENHAKRVPFGEQTFTCGVLEGISMYFSQNFPLYILMSVDDLDTPIYEQLKNRIMTLEIFSPLWEREDFKALCM